MAERVVLLTCKEAGRRGGLSRTRNLSPERRAEIARKAAEARWAKKNSPEPDGPDGGDRVLRPISDVTSIM